MDKAHKYLNYREEDFAADPLFRTWVLAPDEASQGFWTAWLAQHPEKEAVVANARWQMLELQVSEDQATKERLDAVWNRIQQKKALLETAQGVSGQAGTASGARVIPLFSFRALRQVAAVLVLASFCAGLLYYFSGGARQPLHEVSTAYGQTKTLRLPDQSEVVLNGNSRLSYAASWEEGQDREVTLEGEAFFSVTPTKNHQPFRVKLRDGLQVKVLGTQFTVTRRPAKTRVVLSEGKVKLIRQQERLFGLQKAVLAEATMLPGDLVEVREKGAVFRKSRVEDPDSYRGFSQGRIIFRSTRISEVARVLEDTYGYRVDIARTGLADKHFSGTTPTEHIDMLFSAIEKLFGVEVIQEGKHLTIR
ncbi:MAG: FecR family protein [Adhaeribacter sp.]